MKSFYDVIVVGGGPAGIFAALELTRNSNLDILLLEKGEKIEKRHCPAQKKGKEYCCCVPCHQVCGWGGAGAFSDGKLSLSTEVGGLLKDYVGAEAAGELVRYVDAVYREFGATNHLYGANAEENARWQEKASRAGLRLTPVMFRHLGTERSRDILKALYDFLSPRIEVKLGITASHILVEGGEARGVETDEGDKVSCRYVVLAPGREGGEWLAREASNLKLTLQANPVDVGVRVELPATVMEEMTSSLYESKLEFFSPRFNDRLRTFCMCPGGEVTPELTGGSDPVITVNGHSYADRRTGNTNFAILVSTLFTEPFHEPTAYGKYLARLANLLSGGILVQRLEDLKEGRRSTPARLEKNPVKPTLKCATPGDISFVLPFRQLSGIIEMLRAMDKLCRGVFAPSTLLYGIEVKFYSSRLKLSPALETEISDVFAAGDGAGVTRGLVQASASGVVVAREILKRTGGVALLAGESNSVSAKDVHLTKTEQKASNRFALQ